MPCPCCPRPLWPVLSRPASFAAISADCAAPYVSDATVGLLGTLWVNTTLPSGTNTLLGDLTVAPGVTLTIPAGARLSAATTDQMRAYTDTGEGYGERLYFFTGLTVDAVVLKSDLDPLFPRMKAIDERLAAV